jgi:hypothetical protein
MKKLTPSAYRKNFRIQEQDEFIHEPYRILNDK